jgi:hypothetical protein
MTYTPGLGVVTLGRALLGVEGFSTEIGGYGPVAEADVVFDGFEFARGNFAMSAEADLTWEGASRLYRMEAEASINFEGALAGQFAMQANALINYAWVPELCPGISMVNCRIDPATVSRNDQLAEALAKQGVAAARGGIDSGVAVFCSRRREDC